MPYTMFDMHISPHEHVSRRFQELVEELRRLCLAHYSRRLVAMAVFGSVARGAPRPDSDLDVLLVVEGLPQGRVARIRDFEPVEAALAPVLQVMKRAGMAVELSPIFKTPAEVAQGNLLLLDMTEDAVIVYDPRGFLKQTLARLAARLRDLGARRIWRGNAWFWDLKPNFQHGDVIEL
jgi:hypothetical protein